jgi:hypothetical protein
VNKAAEEAAAKKKAAAEASAVNKAAEEAAAKKKAAAEAAAAAAEVQFSCCSTDRLLIASFATCSVPAHLSDLHCFVHCPLTRRLSVTIVTQAGAKKAAEDAAAVRKAAATKVTEEAAAAPQVTKLSYHFVP